MTLLGHCLLWVAFMKIIEVAQIIGPIFGKSYVVFLRKKCVWPTFWAIFSLTHLVTLLPDGKRSDGIIESWQKKRI
jgi:hypothetical protein